MNVLLDLAGVILYYAFMLFLKPLQAVLYMLYGVLLAFTFANKMLVYTLHFMKHLPAYAWMPVRRAATLGYRKLVRVPVHSAH